MVRIDEVSLSNKKTVVHLWPVSHKKMNFPTVFQPNILPVAKKTNLQRIGLPFASRENYTVHKNFHIKSRIENMK